METRVYTEQEAKKYFQKNLGTLATPEFMEWLNDIDMFQMPASSGRFGTHGAYRGGLVDHSITVANELVNLTDRLELSWDRPESPYIIGLLHDVCKTDDYRFDNNDNIISNPDKSSGHATKTIELLDGHLKLTPQEELCIRWHMGAFDSRENWNLYNEGCASDPNVLWTHSADMVASQVLHI